MKGFANNNGVKIHFEVMGKGDVPLVLISGFGGDMDMWKYNAQELCRNFKIILIDNRGIGQSDKPDSAYSMEMFSSDIRAVLQEIGIESAYLLGVSMGGLISLQFYKDYPEMVRGLILVSTIAGIPKRFQPIARRIIKSHVYNFMTGFIIPGVNAMNKLVEKNKPSVGSLAENFDIPTLDLNIINFLIGRKDISRLNKEEYLEMIFNYVVNIKNEKVLDYFEKLFSNKEKNGFNKDSQLEAVLSCSYDSLLSQIQVPTLIIHGGLDKILNVNEAMYLNKSIKNSDLIIYGNCGHYLFLEQEENFNNDISRYIRNWEEKKKAQKKAGKKSLLAG